MLGIKYNNEPSEPQTHMPRIFICLENYFCKVNKEEIETKKAKCGGEWEEEGEILKRDGKSLSKYELLCLQIHGKKLQRACIEYLTFPKCFIRAKQRQ